MTNEIMCAIISAIVGAISGGAISWLLEVRKECKADKKEQVSAQKKIYENRPELEIIDYKDYTARPGYGVKKDSDINIFLGKIQRVSVEKGIVNAQFKEEHFNSEDWCCVVYTFKNVGKTDINCVNPMCLYKRDTVLCDVDLTQKVLRNGILNYSTWYEQKIHIGETFTMKICYHKECVISGMFTATIDMGLVDVNGRYWVQPLFAPENKMYQSSMLSYKQYREQLLPDVAIECFEKPWLW